MEKDKTNDIAPEKVTETRRSKRAVLWTCARIGLILIMMPVVFAFIAALMMIGQDISAPSWVSNRMEARAETVLDGGKARFEDITVNLGKDLHPRVRMNGVTLEDANGTKVAQIESVAGLLSPRGVVLEGKALLQDVAVSGIDVNLRRDVDGSLGLSFGGTDTIAVANDPEALFGQLHAAFTAPALEALETVSASDLRVVFQDDVTGTLWQGDGQRLQLDLKGGARNLRTEVLLQNANADDQTRIILSYAGEQEDLASTVSLEVTDATGPSLAQFLPSLKVLSVVEAPIGFKGAISVDDKGALQPVTLKLNMGEGEITGATNAQVRHINAAATYELESGVIEFPSISVDSDVISLNGAATYDLSEEGAIGQFRATEISIGLKDELDDPISFSEGYADWRMHSSPLMIELGQIALIDDALSLFASGSFHSTEEGLAGGLQFTSTDITRDKALTLWPEGRSPGGRRWTVNNLKKALLTDITGALRFEPGRDVQWSLGFGFEDAEIRVARDTPHVQGASGFASFADGAFGVSVAEGHITAAEGGRINVAGTTVEIPTVRVKGSPLTVAFQSQSTITAVLSVLDQSPLNLMQRSGLPVALADGRSRMQGTVTFPQVNPIPPELFEYSVNADLSRVSSTRLVPNRTVQSSALRLEADNAGMRISGPARLDGAPLTGVYEQVKGTPGGRLRADIELSSASLEALDIDLPPGTISGQGVGALEVDIPKGAVPTFELTSNLRGLRVAVPPIGWAKPPGEAGSLLVAGSLGPRPEVTDLRVSGGGLSAQGRVSLTADKQLEAARFSRLQIGNWFDAPLTLRGRGAGRAPAVEISGGGLDLRRARFGPRQGESGPLEIALNRLQVTEGIALSNFRGSFAGAGGFNGSFTGNLNGGPSVQGTVVPQNGRSAIRLRSDDAGGIARAVGFLKGGTGGSLDLILSPAGGEGTFDGALTITQLRIREAPAMAALLDAISVVGLLRQMDGQGLAFDEVDARFRLTPSQVILSEASAIGPGLGISLDGVYQLANKQLDFQGVVSPLYILNGIGSVLTRKGEGLIGFNFTVKGDASTPQVVVNPLSAFTPGMFREIFRRPAPQVGQ